MSLAEAMPERHFRPISPIWSPQPDNILAEAMADMPLMTPPALGGLLEDDDQELLDELDRVLEAAEAQAEEPRVLELPEVSLNHLLYPPVVAYPILPNWLTEQLRVLELPVPAAEPVPLLEIPEELQNAVEFFLHLPFGLLDDLEGPQEPLHQPARLAALAAHAALGPLGLNLQEQPQQQEQPQPHEQPRQQEQPAAAAQEEQPQHQEQPHYQEKPVGVAQEEQSQPQEDQSQPQEEQPQPQEQPAVAAPVVNLPEGIELDNQLDAIIPPHEEENDGEGVVHVAAVNLEMEANLEDVFGRESPIDNPFASIFLNWDAIVSGAEIILPPSAWSPMF